MALSVASSALPIVGTTGQLAKACCQISSTEDLTGEVINFIPSLFSQSPTDLPSNTSNQFVATYPSSGTVTPMAFVGTAVNRNFVATIEAIDSRNFIICFEFFFWGDLGGYISDAAYNNYNLFGNGGSGYLNFWLEVDGSTALCAHPVEYNAFCQNELFFDLGIDGGFCLGEDLKINISSTGTNLSNTIYAGYFQENSLSNVLAFPADSNLNYVQINNGVGQITAHDGTVINAACITEGAGFTNDGIDSKACMTLSSSCLQAGGKYSVYVVYREGSEWKSCLSPLICEAQVKILAFTEDMIDCYVTDALGNTFENCCVSGLASCGNVDVCVKLNRAVIEAALADKGYNNPVEDYLDQALLFSGSSAAVTTGFSYQLVINDDLEFCYSFNADERLGDSFSNFCFYFSFGQSLCVPVRTNFISTLNVVPAFALDNEEVTEVYCCEDGGTLSFDFGESGCEVFLSEGYGPYVSMGATNELNASLLNCEGIQCVKAVCNGTPEEEENDCECPPIPVERKYFFVRECADYDTNGALNDRVVCLYADIIGQTILIPRFPGDMNAWYEVYNVATETQFNNNAGDQPSTLITDPTVAVKSDCNSTDVSYLDNASEIEDPDCDCEEEEPCTDTNTGYVDWECGDNGITKCETVVNLLSPVESDTGDIKTETTDSNGNVIKCTISREITFGNGCSDLIIHDVIECPISTPCVNSRTLTHTINDCDVTFAVTDNFDSNKIGDKVWIRINGTTTEYDLQNGDTLPNPLTVQDGDSVCYWSNVIFDDGCPDVDVAKTIFTVTKATDPSSCDYSGYSIDCQVDEENCLFTPVFNGDGTALIKDEKSFSIDGSPFATWEGAPIYGQGQLVLQWCIQVVDNNGNPCEIKVLTKGCYIKPSFIGDIVVEPVIEFNPVINVDACCDDNEECTDVLMITCDQCTLTVTADAPGYSFVWCDSNGVELGTGPSYEATVSDTYTAKATKDGCPQIDTQYVFTKPEAGMGNAQTNPIVKQ